MKLDLFSQRAHSSASLLMCTMNYQTLFVKGVFYGGKSVILPSPSYFGSHRDAEKSSEKQTIRGPDDSKTQRYK